MSSTQLSPIEGYYQDSDQRLISLRSTLWVDLEGGMVIRDGLDILLTAREVRMLETLIETMRRSRSYLSAHALAEQLISSDAFDPEHAIEQTISTLRRKLGEEPYAPRILRGRRGIGYRLFPDQHGEDAGSTDPYIKGSPILRPPHSTSATVNYLDRQVDMRESRETV